MRSLVEQRRLQQEQIRKKLLEVDDEKRLRARSYLDGVFEQERLMPGSQDWRAVRRTARMLRRRGCL